jgi:hypothetical protein
LADQPNSVRCLYARACTWALKGQTDRAVADLRQEEPAFIDIIEPTPTPGA